MTTESPQPSDDEVVRAVRTIHEQSPDLGRNKLLDQLKVNHNWTLSDKRLKKLLTQHDLKRVAERSKGLPSIELTKDALSAQQRYKDNSNRCFKLYGRGEYDYGVTPNADQAILIDVCLWRMEIRWSPLILHRCVTTDS